MKFSNTQNVRPLARTAFGSGLEIGKGEGRSLLQRNMFACPERSDGGRRVEVVW